ncbi:hypothetical protein, partial [Micromonospora solifontis]
TGAPSPPPSPRVTGPSSGTPGGPASTSAGPTATSPTSIPDRAFFALPAANQAGGGPRFVSGPVLPAFCGTTPGEESVVARRGRILPFKLSGGADVVVPDGLYRHSVTSYRPGRADDALRELRQAVRDCPRQDEPNAAGEIERQRLLAGGGYGDESVLVEIRAPHPSGYGGNTGGDEVHLLRAIRVGDVVTVLWERGWEGTSTDVAQFDADSRRATEALRRWLG